MASDPRRMDAILKNISVILFLHKDSFWNEVTLMILTVHLTHLVHVRVEESCTTMVSKSLNLYSKTSTLQVYITIKRLNILTALGYLEIFGTNYPMMWHHIPKELTLY